MVDKKTHKFIAVLLAFLMLSTSTGYTMDVHVCQGEVEHISFFGKAKSCHDDDAGEHQNKKMESCHSKMMDCHSTTVKEVDECCHNETIVVEADDSSKASPSISNGVSATFMAAFVAVFVLPIPVFEPEAFVAHRIHKPPPLKDDPQVLFQSFLL